MKKQIDIEDAIKKTNGQSLDEKPFLRSVYCPWRKNVVYEDNLPSLTRQEFASECDVNVIMKNYEATGIMPSLDGRTPIYWDADAVPNNLQDAMGALVYAEQLFNQLPAQTRKEFDNDPVQFVDFASNRENYSKLAEWGLLAPQEAPGSPIRVEVVNPPPTPPTPPSEPPK
ncbi:internal scaffolding protein [robinz microvirus RP_143]|nr:internal scaffolding protein [robinz microvirus RP_143]